MEDSHEEPTKISLACVGYVGDGGEVMMEMSLVPSFREQMACSGNAGIRRVADPGAGVHREYHTIPNRNENDEK